MIAVRMIALEQLVARHRLPLRVARRLVGLADPSNALRQFRRAQLGSPAVCGKLASPGA